MPRRGATRREFLKAGAGVVAAGATAGLWARTARAQAAPRTVAELDVGALRDIIDPCFDQSPVVAPFSAPLPIAPAIGDNQGAVVPVISLAEQRGEHQFIPGVITPIWGYNLPGAGGIFPGPTIFARKLRPEQVTFTNALPPNEEPNAIVIDRLPDPEDHPFLTSSTVVHLHGINADMVSDGYPENRRELGQSQTHLYPNNEYQRPATLWYHDHSVHITSLHVYRGLAGFYILTDEEEDATGLPGTLSADPGRGYGFFDIPLVFKDVMIAPEPIDGRPPGVLIYDNCSHHGAYGDVMTVNGVQQPFFEVANRKYRFRTLNGSDARQYLVAIRRIENLKTGPDEPFFLIGTDHGLLFTPALETTYFHTSVAERFELVFDFSRYPVGQRLVMVNLLMDPDDRKLFPMMAFDVNRVEPDPSRIPPGPLRPPEHPADAAPPVRKRFFLFNRQGGYFSINSLQFDPARVDGSSRAAPTARSPSPRTPSAIRRRRCCARTSASRRGCTSSTAAARASTRSSCAAARSAGSAARRSARRWSRSASPSGRPRSGTTRGCGATRRRSTPARASRPRWTAAPAGAGARPAISSCAAGCPATPPRANGASGACSTRSSRTSRPCPIARRRPRR